MHLSPNIEETTSSVLWGICLWFNCGLGAICWCCFCCCVLISWWRCSCICCVGIFGIFYYELLSFGGLLVCLVVRNRLFCRCFWCYYFFSSCLWFSTFSWLYFNCLFDILDWFLYHRHNNCRSRRRFWYHSSWLDFYYFASISGNSLIWAQQMIRWINKDLSWLVTFLNICSRCNLCFLWSLVEPVFDIIYTFL